MIGALEPIISTLLISTGIFLVVFIAIMITWNILVKITAGLLTKTPFYFISQLLSAVSSSVALAALLISIYAAIVFTNKTLVEHPASKVLGILIIFSVINIVAKTILSGIDFYYRKEKEPWKSLFYRSLPLLKSTIGLFLYAFALLIAIVVLSYEVGLIIALIAIALLVMCFVVFLDQIKNIVAGFHLGTYIHEGMLIRIREKVGFVEKLSGSSILLRTLKGELLVIPNSMFSKMPFNVSNENGEVSFIVSISGDDGQKLKERLSAIVGKIAIKMKELQSEYKPKVFFASVENGEYQFTVHLKIAKGADCRKIMDEFCLELSKEFKNRLKMVTDLV